MLVASDKGRCGALRTATCSGLWDGTIRIRRSSSPQGGRAAHPSPARVASSWPNFPMATHRDICSSRSASHSAALLRRSVPERRGGRGPVCRHTVRQAHPGRDRHGVPSGRRNQGARDSGGSARRALAADTTEFLFGTEPRGDPRLLAGSRSQHRRLDLVLLNAKASEQSARMVSMKSATDNAETMIEDLTLAYNKLRRGTSRRNCWRSRAASRISWKGFV